MPDRFAVWPVQIETRTPRGVAFPVEIGARKTREIIAVRPEVVVHDVENHRQTAFVGGIHQRAQFVGPGR